MKDDFKTSLRSLDEATAAGDRPFESLDAETASLREAWLVFGEMLEAAQPRTFNSPRLPAEEAIAATTPLHKWPLRQPLLAAALLAASLLIAVAVVWTLNGSRHRANPGIMPQQIVANKHRAKPSQTARGKSTTSTNEPQWDDSLDGEFQKISWQMLCAEENQTFRTDAFGRTQYRLEQLRQSIQADSL
jgi:hypothetical protein